MTHDDIARVGHVLDNIKAWCKDVEAYMMRCLQQGIKIGDWKLVRGRSNRAWVDEVLAAAALLAEKTKDGKPAVTEDKLYKKKMNGPAEVEKIIGKKHPLLRSTDAEEDPGLVFKPEGKPKLAPGSDPRPAIDNDHLSDFSVIPDDESEDE